MDVKKHRVLIVGRGRQADIRLDQPSVSRLHLELVLGAGGEIHAADRSSRNGTRIWTEGAWKPLTAKQVLPRDRLQLGDLTITVEELLRQAPPERADIGRRTEGNAGARPAAGPDPDLPSGKVRRNPETGEVVPV